MNRINLKGRPDPKKLAKIAAYYKYNPEAPAYFSDVSRWMEWLKKMDPVKGATYVGKMHLIRKMLAERWASLRGELAFMQWVKNGAQMTHSVPRYDTSKIKDPQLKKLYTDSLFRNNKMSDKFHRDAKYVELYGKHSQEDPDIPPSMSGNDGWRAYFMRCNRLDRLNQLDQDIVTILNTYDKYVKEYNARRKVALDYLVARRTKRATDIPIMGVNPEKSTVLRTQQDTSGETQST
jgi:hypothetical protein